MFQNWPLYITKMCQLYLSRWWLNFGLLFNWPHWKFPFHTLAFAFWSIMVDPCHPMWQCTSKKRHLNYDGGSVGLNRLSNSCTYALLWVVLELILHKSYETKITLGWFYEQNHDGCATSSVVTCQLSKIRAWTCSVFSPVVDVDVDVDMYRRPDRSSSVTLARPVLNMVIHSYALRYGKTLCPYFPESLQWIFPLVHL